MYIRCTSILSCLDQYEKILIYLCQVYLYFLYSILSRLSSRFLQCLLLSIARFIVSPRVVSFMSVFIYIIQLLRLLYIIHMAYMVYGRLRCFFRFVFVLFFCFVFFGVEGFFAVLVCKIFQ